MEYYCIMKEPGTSISIRLSRELWNDVNQRVENGRYPNFSDAVRGLIQIGMWLEDNKEKFKEDDKIQKIREEFEAKVNEEAILEFPKGLSDSKIEAVIMSFQM